MNPLMLTDCHREETRQYRSQQGRDFPVPKFHNNRSVTVYSQQVLDPDGGIRWEINNVSWKFSSTPMILDLYYNQVVLFSDFAYINQKLSSEEGVTWVRKGDVVDMMFVNLDRWDGGQEQHPFHFHGHSVWVLGR